MRSVTARINIAFALSAICGPSITFAHHSPNVHFDRSQTIEFSGELTNIIWRNPHVLMTVHTTDEQGNQTEWELEYLAPSFLSRQGIGRDLFNVGDVIRVAGFPGRANAQAIFTTNILAANGQEVFDFQVAKARFTDNTVGLTFAEYQQTQKPAVPLVADDIFRVWSTDVSLIGPERAM
jgi:hypothetical protein